MSNQPGCFGTPHACIESSKFCHDCSHLSDCQDQCASVLRECVDRYNMEESKAGDMMIVISGSPQPFISSAQQRAAQRTHKTYKTIRRDIREGVNPFEANGKERNSHLCAQLLIEYKQVTLIDLVAVIQTGGMIAIDKAKATKRAKDCLKALVKRSVIVGSPKSYVLVKEEEEITS